MVHQREVISHHGSQIGRQYTVPTLSAAVRQSVWFCVHLTLGIVLSWLHLSRSGSFVRGGFRCLQIKSAGIEIARPLTMVRPRVSRRLVLRGASGVAITLPFLESLVGREAQAAPTDMPKFFVGMVHANGFPDMNTNQLFPGNTGSLPANLPVCLQSFGNRGVAADVMVIRGINHPGEPNGINSDMLHNSHTAGRVLVGANLVANNKDEPYRKIDSVNVAIHRKIQAQAVKKDLRLILGTTCKSGQQASGLDPSMVDPKHPGFLNKQGEDIFSKREYGNIARSGSFNNGQEETNQFNPRIIFNTLFCGLVGDGACPGGGTIGGGSTGPAPADLEKVRRVGVLNFVADRIKSLKSAGRIGATDKQRLDNYLTGIESIEKRINQVGNPMPPMARSISIPVRDDVFPGIPITQDGIGRLHADLIVKAFEANYTNVASLMLGATDGSNIAMNSNPDATCWTTSKGYFHEHQITHAGQMQTYGEVCRSKIDVFAYLVKRLKEVDGEGGKLIDQTVVYYSSDFGEGNSHSTNDVLALVAGGHSKIKKGQFVRLGQGGNNVPSVRVLESIASMFGASLPQANGQGGVL